MLLEGLVGSLGARSLLRKDSVEIPTRRRLLRSPGRLPDKSLLADRPRTSRWSSLTLTLILRGISCRAAWCISQKAGHLILAAAGFAIPAHLVLQSYGVKCVLQFGSSAAQGRLFSKGATARTTTPRTTHPLTHSPTCGCGFLAYSWKLPAYNRAFSLTVDNFSFFCLQLELFPYSGKVRLISASRDCKQRSLTARKKLQLYVQRLPHHFAHLPTRPPCCC